MRMLLYPATVAFASLLSAGATHAQCGCGSGYYGYGPAYYGYAALAPAYGYAAPAYYAYASPAYSGYAYSGYDDDDAVYGYYGGWGGNGYGVAAVGVRRPYFGYAARVGVGRVGYGYRAVGVGRVGYGYRPVGLGRVGFGGRGFRR